MGHGLEGPGSQPARGLLATGSYPLTITANNGVSPAATQSFSLSLNRPPTTGVIALGANRNTPAQVSVARLLAAASDSDGDTLKITSAGPVSGQGYAVTLSAAGNTGTITYTPARGFTGSDSFTSVISDGRGGTTSGTVFMTVYGDGKYPLGVVSIVQSTSAETIIYTGIPGNTYQPQYTNSLTSGSWTNDGLVLTSGSDGRFTYMDATRPLLAQRCYRAVVSP